jgi:hypothetical protein
LSHGLGKQWLAGARTFTGQFQCNKMHQGELRELQKDNTTVIVSNVQYDSKQDQTKKVFPSNQVPNKKEKKGEESIKDK